LWTSLRFFLYQSCRSRLAFTVATTCPAGFRSLKLWDQRAVDPLKKAALDLSNDSLKGDETNAWFTFAADCVQVCGRAKKSTPAFSANGMPASEARRLPRSCASYSPRTCRSL
jgi:hypothetical protein